MINPDLPEAHQLRGWYDSVGNNASYSEYKRDGDMNSSAAGRTLIVFTLHCRFS